MSSKPRIPKEYLGAFKCGHRKASREFIDEDLSWALLKKITETGCLESKRALAYIAKFNNEFYKAVLPKDDPEPLHGSAEMRSDCNRRSYMSKNDVFTQAQIVHFHYFPVSPDQDLEDRHLTIEPLDVWLSI